MKGKQLVAVFISIHFILAGCNADKKAALTNVDVEKIKILINNSIKDRPSLKWNFVDGKLMLVVKFSSFEQQNTDIEMLEKVVS